jgi:VCBS repeat-containing protein
MRIRSEKFSIIFSFCLCASFFSTVIPDVTAQAPACPCSVWSDASLPANAAVTDNQPIEVGVKFRTDVNGYVGAIRFYKGSLNTGVHVAHLWSSTGVVLAEVTFGPETGLGWQQVAVSPPVAVNANTTYIASYYSPSGYFALDQNFFATAGIDNPPLHALQAGLDGPNGVFRYGASGFPSSGGSNNYWVDVVFQTTVAPDTTPPSITATTPLNGATGVSPAVNVSATFSEPINPATLTTQTFKLQGQGGAPVSATLSYSAATRTATMHPTGGFAPQTLYTATITGGSGGVTDSAGNALATDFRWSFTTGAALPAPPNDGPGGPVLAISTAANPFSRYLAEILRNEGLNAFTAMDISLVTPAVLASVDVAVLGETALTPAQAAMLNDFVSGGGSLIAMRPDPLLYGLLGLQSTSSTLSEGYLLVDTTAAPGTGIVGETIQFHGTADRYTVTDGSTRVLAALYANAATATPNPALTVRTAGSNGGRAAAFAFDLARSVLYTRQGNPQWSGQERDGIIPIRSDDLFFGGTERDWVDLSKVAIPQADEQQRLFANLILDSNRHRKPLPRFWYFPRGIKAAIVMTGDDHANGGTTGRFQQFGALSAPGCSVANWECIRGTSYIYNNTPGINNAAALAFVNDGFEIGLHVTTNCLDWTPTSLEGFYADQLSQFTSNLPSIPSPRTNRTHCIAWSDYSTQPHVELAHGIRFDANYYYYPASWIQDRPGFMTGSGMPMRFADADGTTIDVYQGATQMTDESGQSYPFTVDTLLNRALGPQGYYGAFVANMHTDQPTTSQDDAVVASAQAHGVPIVTSRQMLDWIDGRNSSSFQSITWSGGTLSFTVAQASGANGLTALVPTASPAGPISTFTRNGAPVSYTVQTLKGVEYAVFLAPAGNYSVTYAIDVVPPVISGTSAVPGAGGTANITWTTDKLSNSTVNYGVSASSLTSSASSGTLVNSHTVTLTGLSPFTTYYFRVSSTDAFGNTSTSPAPPAAPAQLTMPALIFNLTDTTVADFTAGTPDANVRIAQTADGEVILTPAAGSEFYGTALPADWSMVPWSAGGAATVTAGALVVDGARAGTIGDFGPGRSVEFVATFSGAPFQHMGFAVTYDAAPWAIFSTSGGGALFARTTTGSTVTDTPLGANWLGAPHRFRVDWAAASVTFWIDGAVVATHPVAISANMRPIASDFNVGGGALSMDLVRMSPYVSAGTFASRVFDGGEVVHWGALSASTEIPTGTGVTFAVRTGNTPAPDASWTSFNPISTPGGAIGRESRYAQYRAALASTAPAATPSVDDVTIGFSRNTPPSAANDAYATDQGTTLVVAAPGVLANDTDADGDPLTAALLSAAGHGTLTLNSNGSFSYTPQTGFSGSDSFTYSASDGIANSAPATVSLTVRAVIPTAAPDSYSVNENQTLNIPSPGVLFNDTDPQGRTLQALLVQGPAHGTLTLQSNGSFIYVSAINYSGPDSFIYVATAGSNQSAQALVSITVNHVNQPPTAAADSYVANQGSTLNVAAPGVLANDTDPEGSSLTAVLVTSPLHGTLVLDASGSFTYTPASGFAGTDSFTYKAVDGGGAQSVATTVTITVNASSSDWFTTAWSSGGAVTTANGVLTVDGARTGTNALYGPGRSLEFVATFSGDAWQHIGFGVDYNAAPWIIFSTFQGGQLYARTATEGGQSFDTPISGNWFGTPHRYRIDWNATNTVFSIDGTVAATHAAAPAGPLRPLISDLNVGAGNVVVNSVSMFSSVSLADFSGSGLPANWFSTPWSSDGSALVTNGQLVVDGARAGSNAVYSSGTTLEFVATFTGDPSQHIGFGVDYNAAPWIIFSTYQGGQLYARTATESGQSIDTPIPGNWFGTPHRYRIEWNPMDVVFSIDGTVVAANAATIGTSLHSLISDVTTGGGAVTVNRMEVISPIFYIDFSATSLPSGWSKGSWSSMGFANMSNGVLTVDGALAGSNALYGPGHSLELAGTFSGDAWQHIGFGLDYNAGPWIIFSTFQGGGLYARTRTQDGQTIDTAIPGNWFGVSHVYRIDWTPAGALFSIDGTVVTSTTVTIGANLRPLISDLNAGGGALTVTSIKLVP